LPFSPHATVTSSLIIAAITCSPAQTAIASRPSRTSAITSLIATVTEAGAPGAVGAASIAG